jgi:diguanylate cyclase (GGDEF)-like protein
MKLFEYSHGDLIDMNVDALVPESLRGLHIKHRKEYKTQPTPRAMTFRKIKIFAVTKSGRQVRVEIRLNPITTRFGDQVLVSIRDMADYYELVDVLEDTKAKNKTLAIDAVTDPLTKLFNRRYFNKTGDREFSNSRRYNQAFSLITIDIDHFKKVNDLYGHDIGDLALVEFSQCAGEFIRTGDTLARIGGEEFAVLLPMSSANAAEVMADRIRKKIGSISIKPKSNILFTLTISAGVATLEEDDTCLQDTLNRADKALFKAKSEGRDRVISA